MAKYIGSAGVTYLWKKIIALLGSAHKVSGSDGAYTQVNGGSVVTGNADGDQTIVDNNGVTISGGSITIYEDTSKGGGSKQLTYDELVRLASLKNYTLTAANGSTLGGVKGGGDVSIANGVITVLDDSHAHIIDNVDGLQAALDAKAALASPTFTGTPKAPTAGAGTNTTQIATTAFVMTAVNNMASAVDAMRFKGTIGSTGATVTALPASHKKGDTYKVITAGTYAGQKCEIGDMVICVTTGTTAKDSDWSVVQANVDGAVTGPTSSTSGNIPVFDGATGKVIKDSGKSLSDMATYDDLNYVVDEIVSAEIADAGKSVVNGYSSTIIAMSITYRTWDEQEHTINTQGTITMALAQHGVNGFMSSSDFDKLQEIASGATADSALSNAEIDAAIAAATAS